MSNFNQLISVIGQTHQRMQSQAANAVNQALTIRNWLIGYYIVEFEQNGEDRAKYGKKLLFRLSEELSNFRGLDERSLRTFRQFYTTYERLKNSIWRSATPVLSEIRYPENLVQAIRGSATVELLEIDNQPNITCRRNNNLQVPSDKILSKLYFTHFVELIKVEDALKRTFYEIECIRPIPNPKGSLRGYYMKCKTIKTGRFAAQLSALKIGV